jgi:acyl carrier protein
MDLTGEDVLRAIREIALRELEHRTPIRVDDALVGDLGLDSLTATVLAVGLEDRFRVRLNERAGALDTVGDLISLVQKRAGET